MKNLSHIASVPLSRLFYSVVKTYVMPYKLNLALSIKQWLHMCFTLYRIVIASNAGPPHTAQIFMEVVTPEQF